MATNKDNNKRNRGKGNKYKDQGHGRSDSKNAKRSVGNSSTDICVSNTNDPSWYAATDQLLKDAASLPFAKRVGDFISLRGDEGFVSGKDLSIPGIMTLHMIPTFGNPQKLSDPMNMATSNLFAQVRKHNSGAVNYGKANLMQYMLALGSAYSYYGYLTRLYGMAKMYVPESKYFPRQLYRSMYVDLNDIQNHMAQLRMYINLFAEKLNYFAVPKAFKLYNRMFMLYSNVYLDRPSKKGQVYLFNPVAFHVYGEPATVEPAYVGKLKMEPIKEDFSADNLIKYDDLVAFGDKMINPIVQSQDYDVMSGDIRKAFDSIVTIPQISEDYWVRPVYDDLILEQIHNCDTVFTTTNTSEDDMVTKMRVMAKSDFATLAEDTSETPNAGALVMNADLGTSLNMPFPSGGTTLDLLAENPTPGEVIEATRLKFSVEMEIDASTEGATKYKGTLKTCGTEIVYAITFTQLDYRCDPSVTPFWTRQSAAKIEHMPVTAFNRYPIVRYYSKYENANSTNRPSPTGKRIVVALLGEMQNLTVLDEEALINMNQVAMMSLFAL